MSESPTTSVQASGFLAAVAGFKSWAAKIPQDDRYGEWECDYPSWADIYTEWTSLMANLEVSEWTLSLTETALYAVARDNECQFLSRQIPLHVLRLLAKAARDCSEPDAKWQLAVELGKSSINNQDILLALANDENEYVRRRAVQSLARLGSTYAAELALREWEKAADDFPWSRMNALWVLYRVSSPSLTTLLPLALNSPNKYLKAYAEKIQAGHVDD